MEHRTNFGSMLVVQTNPIQWPNSEAGLGPEEAEVHLSLSPGTFSEEPSKHPSVVARLSCHSPSSTLKRSGPPAPHEGQGPAALGNVLSSLPGVCGSLPQAARPAPATAFGGGFKSWARVLGGKLPGPQGIQLAPPANEKVLVRLCPAPHPPRPCPAAGKAAVNLERPRR